MDYTLITINYEGFSNQLTQKIILERDFFQTNKENIEYALEDNFWAYDLDGEYNHVKGKYSFSEINEKDIINVLSSINRDDKELTQILQFEVENGYEILENMQKVFSLNK